MIQHFLTAVNFPKNEKFSNDEIWQENWKKKKKKNFLTYLKKKISEKWKMFKIMRFGEKIEKKIIQFFCT